MKEEEEKDETRHESLNRIAALLLTALHEFHCCLLPFFNLEKAINFATSWRMAG